MESRQLQMNPTPKFLPAFTLAELLIALAILGVIATFTIPKVLQGQQDSRRAAVFKETIGAISELHHRAWVTGAIGDSAYYGYREQILEKMNVVKLCNSDASTQGCWDTAIQGTGIAPEHAEPGGILHNGAVVTGIVSGTSNPNGMAIDWNGLAGPNTVGDDQMVLTICASKTACSSTLKQGAVGPHGLASITLYRQIFSP